VVLAGFGKVARTRPRALAAGGRLKPLTVEAHNPSTSNNDTPFVIAEARISTTLSSIRLRVKFSSRKSRRDDDVMIDVMRDDTDDV